MLVFHNNDRDSWIASLHLSFKDKCLFVSTNQLQQRNGLKQISCTS